MREQPFDGLSLFGRSGNRKYLNAAERHRFVQAASRAPAKVRLFCLTLRWSGARISEVLALTAASIDIESGVASIESLKRRRRGIYRQVPLPSQLVKQLRGHFQVRRRQRDPDLASVRLWRWSRTTAWRHVKAIMAAAGVTGTQAMPKGLRHGFGVNAFQSNVPPHLVQRWLGHASLKTTAIYGDVIGPEERAFAARMWKTHVERPRARRRGSAETEDLRERGHRFHPKSEKHSRSKERGGQHVRQIF
jgi:integrase